VPGKSLMFPAYDLNHSYEDCDVFVLVAKLKEHLTAGVTLSMKNCFGIAPCTIYGEGAGIDEPSLVPRGGRGLFHDGKRQPSKSAPPEKDPTSPREGGYRVPKESSQTWLPRGRSIWPSSMESHRCRVGKAPGCRVLRAFTQEFSSPERTV
jgi:hypothetical protein